MGVPDSFHHRLAGFNEAQAFAVTDSDCEPNLGLLRDTLGP